jgi:hypothetical protein
MDPTTARYLSKSIYNDRAAEAARARQIKSFRQELSADTGTQSVADLRHVVSGTRHAVAVLLHRVAPATPH